jgi:ribonuclease-3
MQWNTFMEKTINTYGIENISKFVLNEKNRTITKDYIKNIFKTYNISYQPNDIKLFEIAMTHPSYTELDYSDIKNFKQIFIGNNLSINENLTQIADTSMALPLKKISYERLELLGDAILKQIITDYIFCRFDTMDSGDLTKLRACLENRRAFSTITRKLNLNRYILLSRNNEQLQFRETNNKLLCDVFESFIGALYLDCSGILYDDIGKTENIVNKDRSNAHKICHNFIIELIEDKISGPDLCQILEVDTNYIARLQELYHKLNWKKPDYCVIEIIEDETKIGKKYFTIGVRDNNKNIIAKSTSHSKSIAKQNCAKDALKYLNDLHKNI